MDRELEEIRRATAHRPYPLPPLPWIMTQTWNDLLFAHWPVLPSSLRPLVPSALELDTIEGRAWVGIVPFGITDAVLRGLALPRALSAFPELNVRTYVVLGGRPGVYFFSLDAGSPPAVAGARLGYRLPYYRARMEVEERDRWVLYRSLRTHSGAQRARLSAAYRPTGEVFQPDPGTLDHWLTERYCLYTTDRAGRVYRADIHHLPWPLQRAEAEIRANTMAEASGIELPSTRPLLHFAKRHRVLVWPLLRVTHSP